MLIGKCCMSATAQINFFGRRRYGQATGQTTGSLLARAPAGILEPLKIASAEVAEQHESSDLATRYYSKNLAESICGVLLSPLGPPLGHAVVSHRKGRYTVGAVDISSGSAGQYVQSNLSVADTCHVPTKALGCN